MSILADVHWQPDLIMATLDVVSLYTSIKPKLGLEHVATFLEKRPATLWNHTEMLVSMMDIILNNNFFFVYNKQWFQQTKGVAMGSKFSPSFANLYMGALEAEWIWGPKGAKWTDYIVFWGRYIDDCLLLWSGSEAVLNEFCTYLNSNDMDMIFTCHSSSSSVTFLDLELYIKENTLHSRLYRKETSCNAVLHALSAHPTHQINPIPFGEFIRARRNCSEEQEFHKCLSDMKTRFKNRGYHPKVVNRAAHRIRNVKRISTLATRNKPINTEQAIRLITDFNGTSQILSRSVHKHWRILLSDNTLKSVRSKRPQITYRKGQCLRHKLCPTIPHETAHSTWLSAQNLGFFKCGFCGVCKHAKLDTRQFSGPHNTVHKIKHNINCTTRFVVYVLECTCHSRYVGSTIRPLKERISEHIRAINQQDVRYPMAIHIGSCPTQGTHKRLQFFGIDVTHDSIRGGNRELRLRRQEAFWIMRLQTVKHGQNHDHELQYFLGT